MPHDLTTRNVGLSVNPDRPLDEPEIVYVVEIPARAERRWRRDLTLMLVALFLCFIASMGIAAFVMKLNEDGPAWIANSVGVVLMIMFGASMLWIDKIVPRDH